MQQALHIFKKDVLFLRYHLAITLLAAGAFCLMSTFNIDGAGPTAFILPVTWWLLIAAVIHAEPRPGKGHFWLTRPYNWRRLLYAKALFIMVFVNIPVLVADVVIVHAAGFPVAAKIGGLLWTQMLLLSVFEIPAAAIASITSGLLELLIATLFLILAGLAWVLVGPMIHLGFFWAGLDWVRNYYLFSLLALGAGTILLWQYAYRATLATRIAAVLGLILLFASDVLLPWTAAFQLQTHFSKRSVDISSLQVRLDSERKWAGHAYPGNDQDVVADLPIQVEGLPVGVELKLYGVTMTLLAPNGQTWALKALPPQSFECDSDVLSLRLIMAKTLYENFNTEPLQLRGMLYLSLYEKHRSASIPLHSRPRYVDGLGLCAATSQVLLCDSAFRRPSSSVEFEVTQQSPKGPVRSREQLSRFGCSSPFPADFNIDPVFRLLSPRLTPISDVLIMPSEPIAYSKKSFAIDHLVLADFTFRN